ncbi:MAG: trigger factor [Paracoccaceae bacterium]|nr:trigger factor [Paracoccaceae bacterium]
MQITETLNDGLRRGYVLTATSEDVHARIIEKLEEYRPTLEIRGFRKGKAPIAVLRTMFGKQVEREVRETMVKDAVDKHFEESDDRPAQRPSLELESPPGDQELRVTFSYECLPVIPELDYASVELERPVVTIGDDAVDDALGVLAMRAGEFVDREPDQCACRDDIVVLNLEGRVDGKVHERLNATDYPLILGSGTFIPELESGLVGVKAGETLSIDARLPEDFHVRDVAGKNAEFCCEVLAIRESRPHPIDLDLAKTHGHESLGELRENVRDDLRREHDGKLRVVVKQRLFDALEPRLDFDVPDGLYRVELADVMQALAGPEDSPNSESAGDDEPGKGQTDSADTSDISDGDGSSGMAASADSSAESPPDAPTDPEPTEEHHRIALRRLRIGLLLMDVAREQGISVSDDDMYRMYVTMGGLGTPSQAREMIRTNGYVRRDLHQHCIEDKAVASILSRATISDTAMTPAELDRLYEDLDDTGNRTGAAPDSIHDTDGPDDHSEAVERSEETETGT